MTELALALRKATEARVVKWQSAHPEIFFTRLSLGDVRLRRFVTEEAGEVVYALAISSGQGLYEEMEESPPAGSLLEGLYNLARRSALNFDVILDEMVKDLHRQLDLKPSP